MEFTFAKSKKVLSFHEIIFSHLLCIYIKNAETAIIWQNLTHKTTGVREIWAQARQKKKKKKILDELFWDMLFSELDSNKSHSAGILSGSHIEPINHLERGRIATTIMIITACFCLAWQIRPGVEQERSCDVRQAQPRPFMFDPQILRQVKQWQAFLHEQAEIFLARPDLWLWQKARRRSASMPFHVPQWTDNVLQFRRLFKSRCCPEKKKRYAEKCKI